MQFMKKQITIAVLLLVFKFSSAQELKPEYQEVVRTFVECVKNNNTDKLQNLIAYPLNREYPLAVIKNQQEFKKRYNEVFDDSLKRIITSSDIKKDWSAVGWRGIMLHSGVLWLDHDGRLITVNYLSALEQTVRAKLIADDRSKIHESIRDYKEPLLIIETRKFRIRIDKLNGGKYRYASWSVKSAMSEKPDLILQNGSWIPEGSGGNHRYEFINYDYKYECYVNVLGGNDTAPAGLIVSKKGKEILNEPAQIAGGF